jgi:hypothetical protein
LQPTERSVEGDEMGLGCLAGKPLATGKHQRNSEINEMLVCRIANVEMR